MPARRPARARAAAVATGAAVLGALAVPSPSLASHATDSRATAGFAPTASTPASGSARGAAGDLLADPARGRAAVTELGGRIDVAAARNDLSARALEDLLLEDRTMWLDETGRLYAVDPAPPAPEAPAGRASADPAAGVAPLDQTFALHSNPGATRTIFLDVDGAVVSGTGWNTDSGVGTTHPAWDPAGNGASFTDAEKLEVQKVWAIVAEDYAPWQVDVTTADPGTAGLTRTGPADLTYGTRALITPSPDAWSKLCDSQCGGVAYLGVYGGTGDPSPTQPAWVFPPALDDDAKAVAEAISHEVGHNLGLTHDGNATSDYDEGHGAWAPIMGASYYEPITQWSQGSYVGANNSQDDLATITGYLPRRADEAGPTVGGAAALPATGVSSYITDRTDVDAFRLGSCGSGATATISPAEVGADLDVKASLLDPGGAVVATSDPASTQVDRETASGMGASLTIPAGTGSTLLVDGTGNGPWSTGYDDYASLGAYTVTVTGCTSDTSLPSAPTAVAATPDASAPTITLTWAAPSSPGASAITGYRVTRLDTGAGTLLPASARSFAFTGLEPGTRYDLTVAAVNGSGPGPVATTSATTYSPTTTPGAPRGTYAVWNADPDRVKIAWAPPADDGGAEVTSYAVRIDGTSRGSVAATFDGVYLSGPFSLGTHTATIRAVNAAGAGPPVDATFTVAAPPANDDAGAARALTGATGATSGTTFGATGAAGDPVAPAGAGRHSVWFTWTAPSRAPVRFATGATTGDTRATARDTTLAIYRGAPGSLVEVAANDDSGSGTFFSAVDLTPVAGTRYLVVVDSFSTDGAAGPFTLAWASTELAPGAPSRVSATRGDGSALVSWSAGEPGTQPVTGWRVTASPGGRQATVGGSASSATVGGLRNGTSYRFSVQALSAAGDSPSSVTSPAVVPAGVPLVMARPRVQVRGRTMTVRWSPAGANGDPVTGYQVVIKGARNRTMPAAATRLVIRRMRPGRYALRIQAANGMGLAPLGPTTRVRVRR